MFVYSGFSGSYSAISLSSQRTTELKASLARYEAAFGDELAKVTDSDLRTEAKEYAREFSAAYAQTETTASSDQLSLWRTSPMVQVDNHSSNWAYYHKVDHISMPAALKEVFDNNPATTSRAYYRELAFAPARKFSFDPPQLHTVSDLPAEEWYNFDWNGVIDGMVKRLEDRDPVFVEALKDLKEALAPLLPESPSPKNEEEAFFWQELQTTGVMPSEYYQGSMYWESMKRLNDAYQFLGFDAEALMAEPDFSYTWSTTFREAEKANPELFKKVEDRYMNYMKGIGELTLGNHWADPEAYGLNEGGDPFENIEEPLLAGAMASIKEEPQLETALDESLSFDERFTARIALDKMMRNHLETGWESFLENLRQETLMKEPLKTLLAEM